jgi:ribosomal protein S6
LEKRLYEGMFIVDSAKGGSDFPAVVKHIAGILKRYDADIERIEKWDDRKLVYPIKRVERGIYVLVYFRCPPGRLAEIRHDIRLSEQILRALVIVTEQATPPKGELYTADGEVIPKEAAPQPAASPQAQPTQTP